MTIWLLAIILVASVAALGLRQGGIRVGFSFLGIIFGVLLAGPLAKLIKPLLGILGVKSPLLLWALPPLIGFILISIIFKIAAFYVHQRVDVFYKYKAGDLRLALWEKLNQRLGLSLGILNGVCYLILVLFAIYPFSYWTYQLATSPQEPKMIRLLNKLGKDLQTTGLNKVARSVDPLQPVFYELADLAGVVFNNPLAEARVSNYPGFLGLAERSEFQDLGRDSEFTDLRLRHATFNEIYNHPRMQSIILNKDLVKAITDTVIPNLADFRTYLDTGRTPKFEPEPILGRWKFDPRSTLAAVRKARPNISSREMQAQRAWVTTAFAKASMVATPEKQAVLKNLPATLRAPSVVQAPPPLENKSGTWDNVNGKYLLSFSGNDVVANIEGGRLSFTSEGATLVFERE
jgi:hypothetical protein